MAAAGRCPRRRRGGSGGSKSWQGKNGNVSGSRSVTQTSSGYNVNRQASTAGGASHEVNKDVNTSGGQVQSVDRSSTATNASGQTANRDRTTTNQGGYATVQGSASTSTGKAASGQGAVGKNAYGQTVAAGSVNTKYNGSYAGAAKQNPNGGWNTATVGPYGGKVTTTLPSGYKTTTYAGTALLRLRRGLLPALHVRRRALLLSGAAALLLPVPLRAGGRHRRVVAGATLHDVGRGATTSRRRAARGKSSTRRSRPRGATLQTLPVDASLVTVGGTTYYLYANTFYRRVVQGGQEQFVVVSPPAGVVFVARAARRLPGGAAQHHVLRGRGASTTCRYLTPDGKELYVVVDAPPQPPATAARLRARLLPPSPRLPRRRIAPWPRPFTVPAGTLVLVRLQADLSSANAHVGRPLPGLPRPGPGGQRAARRHPGSRVYGRSPASTRATR